MAELSILTLRYSYKYNLRLQTLISNCAIHQFKPVDHSRGYCDSKPIVSPDIKFVPSVEQQFNDNTTTFRKHPGLTHLKTVSLPDRLLKAVQRLLHKYPSKDLVTNSGRLTRYLWGRKAPVEDNEIRTQATEIRQKLINSLGYGGEVHTELTELESDKQERQIQQKTVKQLRRVTYHWQPVNYTAYNAFLYMVGRLPTEYATVLQCFNEIKILHPEYSPTSIYDFGSGVGSAVWASHQMWGKSLLHYYCVDNSTDMNTLARLLLQDGEEDKPMCIPGVSFRNFAPSSQNKFDMTVCAYTLFELASSEERADILADLWAKTLHYMVLIDNGSHAGFRMIIQARDFILNTYENDVTRKAHVFAPCAHSLQCPMIEKERRSSCVTEVNYNPLDIVSKTKSTERYSYVILSKLEPTVRWPRVVQDVLKPSRHTHLHVCDTQACLRHLVITHAKNSKDVYKSSRYTKLGDTFPVIMPTEQPINAQDPTPTVIDSSEAWSLQDTPTKVSIQQGESGRYMVQCTANSDKFDS